MGLSKTGSTSLGAALESLGLNNVHNDRSLVPVLFPEGRYDFHHRYDEVDAVEDLPTAAYYKEMLEAYPTAKFVLTVRDTESWYQSYSSHHADTLALYGGVLPYRLRLLTEHVYGTADDNKEVWIQHYNAHNKRVRETIPKHQLLELDVSNGDGWAQLCPYLGMTHGPCADPSQPFPRENTKESREAGLLARSLRHGIQWTPETQSEHSKYAYVSLLAYPSSSEHRDYFVSFLVAADSIRQSGSKQDIVALIYGALSSEEESILQSESIKYIRVGPVGATLPNNPEAFDAQAAAIYRAKLRALQLVDYEMVVFFDSDVIFHHNCDDLFEQYKSHQFVGRIGQNSPFNAGLFFVRPSWQAFIDMNDIAMTLSFSQEKGWLEFGLIPDWRDNRQGEMTDWSFYGASVEQGLMYYYYFCQQTSVTGLLLASSEWEDLATHFTGFNKPFINMNKPMSEIPSRFRRASKQWHDVRRALDKRVTAKLTMQAVDTVSEMALQLSGKETLPEGYPLFDPYPPTPPPPGPKPPGFTSAITMCIRLHSSFSLRTHSAWTQTTWPDTSRSEATRPHAPRLDLCSWCMCLSSCLT